MLKEITHWIEIVASIFDLLLLLRILLLRLHKIYVFITLACLLEVLFDGVMLWLGRSSDELSRVFFYWRYLYAVIYPLVAWDVFEEIKTQVARIRRLALARLLSGLVLAAVFSFVLAGIAGVSDEANSQSLVVTIGLVLWVGSSTASLAFIWTLQRSIRTDRIELPNNTFVWSTYYLLVFIFALVNCFLILAVPFLNTPYIELIDIVLMLVGVTITGWCILKLRGTPSDVPSAPENASL